MASAIDPDKKSKRSEKPGESGASLAKPAAANPGARPAKPGPAVRPAPAPQPRQSDQTEDLGRDQKPGVGASLLRQTPAWAVSMVVHVIALLAMALIVTEPPKKEAVVAIVSTAPEEEEAFEEIKDDLPDTPVETADPVTDIAVTSDVAVEDVQVVADSNDVDAAPLAVDMSDFGDITAPASDMMSTIGAIGGTGSGFGGRKSAAKLAGARGGSVQTEAAVDRALRWFIEHQLDDGSWHFDLKKCPTCQGKCKNVAEGKIRDDPTGATAMALLPFFGRGFTHRDGPYQQQIQRGIDYLAAMSVKNQGKVYQSQGTMYSQGLATIALTEAYGMTQDEQLETPAQLALYFIEQAQDPGGGGWRYQPKKGGDTSALGWQFMALKSGHLANLRVSPAVIKNGLKFLDSVEAESGAGYGYQTAVRVPSCTAVGLLCRMYGGWDQDNPALERGVAYLASQFKSRKKDLYFNYYATQVMHHYGGQPWQEWNVLMQGVLLPNQATAGHEAGSWLDGVDAGHASVGGRLYATSLATLMLEVYYRHMPIYGEQATKTKQ